MTYQKPYTLFTRKIKGGKEIYYYRTRNKNGKRTSGRSTGQTTKAAAQKYCDALLKEGRLDFTRELTLNEFSKNYFHYDRCPYVQSLLIKDRHISRNYVKNQRSNLDKHILPAFGSLLLKDISRNKIDEWLLLLKTNGLSNSTVNNNLATLSLLLNESIKKAFITSNPAKGIAKFKLSQNDKKGILSTTEVSDLLSNEGYEKYWDNQISYIATCLAASTGMRLGEIQALQYSDICDIDWNSDLSNSQPFIFLKHSWDKYDHKLKCPKNGETRIVPLTKKLCSLLCTMRKYHDNGFVFSLKEGLKPVDDTVIRNGFYRALECFGINPVMRKDRKITFHSWRAYANTMMRYSELPDIVVRQIIGHKSISMTEHYSRTSKNNILNIYNDKVGKY